MHKTYNVKASLSGRYNLNTDADQANYIRKNLHVISQDKVMASLLMYNAERLRIMLDHMHLSVDERHTIENVLMPLLGVDHL